MYLSSPKSTKDSTGTEYFTSIKNKKTKLRALNTILKLTELQITTMIKITRQSDVKLYRGKTVKQVVY